MALYSTIPAPEAAVDEESLLNTAAPKKTTRKWATTLAAVCLASAVVGSAAPGAVSKLYNLATAQVSLVDSHSNLSRCDGNGRRCRRGWSRIQSAR